jgi:hypothetical protein
VGSARFNVWRNTSDAFCSLLSLYSFFGLVPFRFDFFLYYFLEFIADFLFLYHWFKGVVYLMVSSRALCFRFVSHFHVLFMIPPLMGAIGIRYETMMSLLLQC